jgi:hypothetical protein
MGVREKAVVIRQEAEERILSEIKRLERAQLLVRINGKSYYELMHKMRLEIDEQEKIMSKHRHDFFNLNTIETMLLGALVFLCLCAVMTNSKYLLLRDYSIHSLVVVCVALTIIVSTTLYFLSALIHEIKSTAKKKKTRREMLWARIKSNSAKIRGMKGLKNARMNNSPFALSKFVKKTEPPEMREKNAVSSLSKIVPSSVYAPEKSESRSIPSITNKVKGQLDQKSSNEDGLSSLSSSLSSSSESKLKTSSNDDVSSSSDSVNSDEELRQLLRSEVKKSNSVNNLGEGTSLIGSNNGSRNISEDESSLNGSYSDPSDSENSQSKHVESDSTSDDSAPTL